VLEPLSGYILLAEKLFVDGKAYTESWNFGPADEDCIPVGTLVQKIYTAWGKGATYKVIPDDGPHEAAYLKLDCSKAESRLQWHPRWRIEKAISQTVAWYRNVLEGNNSQDECLRQIEEYETSSQ
jgi:CDP-glucose 4,6-dehydratase